jgi:hypothetical protein
MEFILSRSVPALGGMKLRPDHIDGVREGKQGLFQAET